jgi:YbbR domain-containing protein
MNTLETRFFSVPLRVETNKTDNMLIPANPYQQIIRVSIRGESNSIYPILEDDIEAYIDLDRYSGEGTYKIPVHIRRKGSALSVVPLEISAEPMEIQLKLEKNENKKIQIVPVFNGIVANGFELASQTIIPDHINAEGPRSLMESINVFHTQTIELDGRYEDFSVIVNITNNNPLLVIHGSRMIEYRGSIRRIMREPRRNNTAAAVSEDIVPEKIKAEN